MRTDVLVIGGGLAGCAAAYYLSRAGADVILLERHDINTQASGSNAGSIHAQIPHKPFVTNGEGWARNFAPAIPFLMESIKIWNQLGTELDEDLEVSIVGGLLVAENSEQMDAIRRKSAIEREYGLPVELLGSNEIHALAPYVSKTMVGGAFCPIEGKANPLAATPAFARAAERFGARLLRRTELQALERDGGAFRAHTSGGLIEAKRVLDCAGADAGEVARLVGIELPIEGHPIQVNVTEPTAPLVKHLVYFAGGRLTLKQTKRGALLIGGGWPARIDKRTGRLAVNLESVRENLRVAQIVVPEIGGVQLLRTWPAIVNGTPDWKPIVGEIPRVPGFYLAMFPYLGFTAGPLAAKLIAQIILGQKPEYDVSPFSSERYN